MSELLKDDSMRKGTVRVTLKVRTPHPGPHRRAAAPTVNGRPPPNVYALAAEKHSIRR